MRPTILFSTILGLALSTPDASTSKTLPDITLKDLTGQKQHLAALKGNIVVLNFWATWCGPCQEELPLLAHLTTDYAGKPVRIIAISIDENKTRPQLADFLSKRHLHLETWTGATTDTMAKAGLGDIVPSTLILDPAGAVITRITGEAQENDIRSRLDWLLSGRPGPPPESTLDRSRS